jgi:hypothetical protein
MNIRHLLLALALAVVPGCAASEQEDDQDVSEDELIASLSGTSIPSARAYGAFSTEGGGFGQAGRSMKFLIDARTTAKKIHFINANYKVRGTTPDYAKYHFYFAQKQLGITESNTEFNRVTYDSDAKRFYAGTVQTYTLGNTDAVTYAIQFYPDDPIHEEGLLEAIKVLRAQFKIPGAKIAFVATGPQQTFARIKSQLTALGIAPMTIEQVLGAVKYLPLNPGEAWGYLRIFPTNHGDLRPTDIPVFDELPLDLSVVAGTITKAYQDTTSHVNLKSKERGTPNMVLRDASKTHALLAPFANKPVHLVVGKTGFKVEATTAAIVEQKLRDRTNKPWIPLQLVNEPNVLSFDAMCSTLNPACLKNASRFGGKAANLGFLANRSVLGRFNQSGSESARQGYDLVPFGVGLPVQRYRDFVEANPALKAKLATFIAAEKSGTLSPNDRKIKSKEIQELFYDGRVPADALADLTREVAALKTRFPTMDELKVRSSSNAEDIPNFDGAGLHDSFSAKMDAVDNADFSCALDATTENGVVTKLKIKPRTPQCALKGVYASLWNTRAVEERSFARLDHATSGMGIALVPAYDTESPVVANGVAITRVINGDGILGYTLSLQEGNNLVTNPEPGTLAQMTVATFASLTRPPRFTVARFATPKAGAPQRTSSVLTEAQMLKIVDVVRAAEQAYCTAKPGYFTGNCKYVHLDDTKASSLDMEFKILQNGHIVLKQLREFHGQ